MSIKLNSETFGYINLFENVTKARVLDCISQNDKLIFIIAKGQLGIAIGKGGKNISRLRNIFKKRINVIEHSDNPHEFIKNIFHNYKISEITINENIASINVNLSEKGAIIGKAGQNLKIAKELVKRHHNIEDIVVN